MINGRRYYQGLRVIFFHPTGKPKLCNKPLSISFTKIVRKFNKHNIFKKKKTIEIGQLFCGLRFKGLTALI